MAPSFSVVSVSKRVVEALNADEIDSNLSYKLFTQCAQEQFPDCSNAAEATEKFRQTPHGAAWFNAERQAVHTKMQTDNALGADEGLVKFFKLGGGRGASGDNPASRQTRPDTPSVSRPSEAPRSNGGPPLSGLTDKELFDRAVEYLAMARGITADEAISQIYNAEKAAKARGDSLMSAEYAKAEPADYGPADEPAGEKVARILKSHPNMTADEAHTIAHRAERLRKFGF